MYINSTYFEEMERSRYLLTYYLWMHTCSIEHSKIISTHLLLWSPQPSFVNLMLSYMQRLNDMQMSEHEESMYCALLLFNFKRPRLTAHHIVERLSRLIFGALRRHVSTNMTNIIEKSMLTYLLRFLDA